MKGNWLGPILGLCVLAFLIWISSVGWHPVQIVRQYFPSSTPAPTPTSTFLDYFDQGLANLAKGRYRAAIEDFDEAVRLNPDFALSYMNRGVAKGRLARNEEAIQDYSRAIELDPSDACAFRNRGITKARLDQFRQALTDLDSAINKRSRYSEAYTSRGWVNISLKKYRNAIEDFDQAIRMRNDLGTGSNIELCAAEEEPDQHLTPTPDATLTSGPTSAPTPTSTPNPCPLECFSDDEARYIRAYWGRGYAYYRLGDNRAALADLEIALELAQKFDDDESAESVQDLIDAIK